jgi:uncharacterized protein YciI
MAAEVLMLARLAALLSPFVLVLAGCSPASRPPPPSPPATEPSAHDKAAHDKAAQEKPPQSDASDYVFVWLKTGPKSAEHTKEERSEIFKGHMANMKRLAAEKKLIVAGPFGKEKHDPADRGIFVFDVSSVDEARRLVETDPGVQSGEFRAQVEPMRSSPTLRKSLDLEKEVEAKAKSEGREVGMQDMRSYVLVTVKDMSKAEPVLTALEPEGTVIFSGRFGGDVDGQGVVVLDAKDVKSAREALGPALEKMGECSLDDWFASKSLEGLRGLRRAR